MLSLCVRRVPQTFVVCSSNAGARAAPPSSRRLLSSTPEELLAARQARRALRGNTESSGGAAAERARKSGSGGGGLKRLAVLTAVGGGGAALVHYKGEELKKLYEGSPLADAVAWVSAQVAEIARPFTDPASDKLLPDWPLPNVPPDMPCPPTLVLDLEETLVATVWDRKHGWRVAKRPGVDKFLAELANYYEIAVMTGMLGGIADPIITSLDPKGYIMYRLFRESTLFKNGKHVKDMSKMNRDIRKIVLVDKDPGCFQLQPDNAILVKPYRVVDGVDPAADKTLEVLLPFLRALALEGVEDVRPVLRRYKGMNAEDIGLEYREKVTAARAKRAEADARGLGGLIRGSRLGVAAAGTALPPPLNDGGSGSSGAIPSSKEIVGAALAAVAPAAAGLGSGPAAPAVMPVPPEKAGGVWKRWRERSKEADEDHQRKMEVWHRVMTKKEEERRSRAA